MGQARGHHTVPKFYLRRFADARECLLVARRDDLTIRRFETCKNACKRRDFYALEGPDGWTDKLESKFSDLEGAAAPALSRLLSAGFPLTARDRQAISTFVALQFLRGTNHREVSRQLASWFGKFKLMNMPRAQVVEGFRATQGREPTEDEVEQAVAFMRNADGYEVEPHQNELIDLQFTTIEPARRNFLSRKWRVLQWEQPCLLTCDAPVVLGPPPEGNQWGPVSGIVTAERILYPLDRRSLLVLDMAAERDGIEGGLPPALALVVNRIVADHAHELIFAHPEQADVLGALDLPPKVRGSVMQPEKPLSVVPPDR